MAAPPNNKGDHGGIPWPRVAGGGDTRLSALLTRLDATQWLARPAIDESQGRHLAQLAEHHGKHTPSFVNRLKAAGIRYSQLDSLSRLSLIEPISRRRLQELGRGFHADHVPADHLPLAETTTSGSTGEPVTVQRTSVSRLYWAALTIRDHLWNARDISRRLTSIRPLISKYVEARDWGFPLTSLFHTGPAQGIPSSFDIKQQSDLITSFKPDTLLVFPTNLQGLLAEWEKPGAPAITSIKHIRTVGETVSASLRKRVRALTDLRIEDSYSSQEGGIIAIECPVSGLYHVMAESVIVEVLDTDGGPCQDGQVGRVVVTDLHNFASPLIRYDIGDYAEVGGSCPCGRSLPTLRRVLGRERNLVIMPDGTRHWPLVGFHQFDTVAPVLQFQVIQHTLQDVELKVVTESGISRSQELGLAAIVQHALGYPSAIRVVQSRSRLTNSPGGKFEEFICRIPAR